MIILIGLPKSGTTSFNELFTRLGYRTYHWKKGHEYIGTMVRQNKERNRPLLEGFGKDDCITQMDVCISKEHCYWPQIVDYEQLYRENPDAIFILNKRDPDKVLSSFKKWNALGGPMDRRLFMYNPELVESNSDDGFVSFVHEHYSNIERFFSTCPDARFVSYDVERDSLEKLRQHIDIMHFDALPHANKGTEKLDGFLTESSLSSSSSSSPSSFSSSSRSDAGFKSLLGNFKADKKKRKKTKKKRSEGGSPRKEGAEDRAQVSEESAAPSKNGGDGIELEPGANEKAAVSTEAESAADQALDQDQKKRKRGPES